MKRSEKKHPSSIQFVSGEASMEFHAEAEGDGESKRPTFEMVAYTGGALRLNGFYRPVVIDLAGLRSAARVTILKDHDQRQIVGQANSVQINAKRVSVAGVITGDETDDSTRTILLHARNGFAWPVSVGASIDRLELVKEQQTVTVNGRDFTGPMYVVRAGLLREVSFVGVGADENAEGKIAAHAANENEGVSAMTFTKWLQAKGHDKSALSDDELDVLAVEYHEEQAGENHEEKPKTAKAGTETDIQASDDLAAERDRRAVEVERITGIQAACGGLHGEIEAKAIREGWSVDKAELEVLRASRAKSPAVHTGGEKPTSKAIEAGLAMQSQAFSDDRLAASYDAQTLDQADQRYRRLSLKGMIAAACSIDGRQAPHISATPQEWAQAAFSTNAMESILSSSANKIMLESFRSVPSAAMKLFKRVPASDFKVHTGYRLTGANNFGKVGQDGELKHGQLGDESKAYKVDTYGELLGITRQMIVNDDLGILLALMTKIGLDAARRLEAVAWDLVKANTSTFFGSGNKNYISGTDTVLGISGLDAATQKLAEMVDSDGEPVMVTGKHMVVPPALSAEASRLYKASNVIATGTGSSKKVDADANNYEGQFEPVVVPHLSATVDSSNGDDAAWYLWGDPSYLSPFAVAFLNGVDRPTIEEVPVSGEYLGKLFRGYLDFGVAQWDTQGAVKSKGGA